MADAAGGVLGGTTRGGVTTGRGPAGLVLAGGAARLGGGAGGAAPFGYGVATGGGGEVVTALPLGRAASGPMNFSIGAIRSLSRVSSVETSERRVLSAAISWSLAAMLRSRLEA